MQVTHAEGLTLKKSSEKEFRQMVGTTCAYFCFALPILGLGARQCTKSGNNPTLPTMYTKNGGVGRRKASKSASKGLGWGGHRIALVPGGRLRGHQHKLNQIQHTSVLALHEGGHVLFKAQFANVQREGNALAGLPQQSPAPPNGVQCNRGAREHLLCVLAGGLPMHWGLGWVGLDSPDLKTRQTRGG